MQRNGFLPAALLCLAVVLPGCDITINSGSSDTDAPDGDTEAPDEPDDDTDAPEEPVDGTTSGAAESSSGGDDASGDDTTGDDTTGDDPTGNDPTGDGPTGDDTTGDDPTGDAPTGDDPIACADQECEACLQCSVQPGESCNDVAETCADDRGCYAFAECYSECAALPAQADYEACWFDQCVANWPDAEQAFSSYLNCLFDTCETQCG